MSRTPYQLTDEAAEKIISKIHKEFRHNRLALFDEMNVIQTRKHIKKLYKSVYQAIKKELGEILEDLSAEIYDEASALGFDGELKDLDEAWIEEFFDEYNPTTKYVFSNELDRKESRLFESIVADIASKLQSYKTAERLLSNQIKHNSILFEDAVQKITYKGMGVKKVKWIAEDDHKTCSVCRALDQAIFLLEEVPFKPHPNCRCYLIPEKNER